MSEIGETKDGRKVFSTAVEAMADAQTRGEDDIQSWRLPVGQLKGGVDAAVALGKPVVARTNPTTLTVPFYDRPENRGKKPSWEYIGKDERPIRIASSAPVNEDVAYDPLERYLADMGVPL
jgi:hypothetical protein